MFFLNPIRRWRVKRKKRVNEQTLVRYRIAFLEVIVVAAFLVLLAQLWRLQIVEGSQYQERAEANRIRLSTILPPRGVVYDRQGRLLVKNQPTFTAAAVMADVPKDRQAEIAAKLETLLRLPAGDINKLMDDRRRSGHVFTPVSLKTDLDPETAFIIEERHWELPGVSVLTEPRRYYADEGTMAHILGYVGRISAEEYDQLKDRSYDLNDSIGKMGVESTYEDALRGLPGREQLEVDAAGRRRKVLLSENAKPGDNLVLSVDLALQKEMYRVMRERMGESRFGAAVAMDPRNGEILGMASLPSFDQNVFSGTIGADAVEALLQDPRRPLINYALGGTYPPGSIFKMITGTGALQDGLANANTVIVSRPFISVASQYDPKVLYYFYDWASLGPLNFTRAVAMSSDVYFYYLGGGYQDFRGLGAARLGHYTRMYGLGERTGIDLPGEAKGSVPSPEWKQETFQEEWLLGDTYNFSIGQGFLHVTPIQMVRALSALVNGGEVLQPHVARAVEDPQGNVVRNIEKTVQRRLEISLPNLELFKTGMRLAVSEGTARTAQVPGVAVGGKTGTAEFGLAIGNRLYETHGWFMGYAPADNPEIAIVVFFDRGNGALNSAPAASKILRYYFEQVRRPAR